MKRVWRSRERIGHQGALLVLVFSLGIGLAWVQYALTGRMLNRAAHPTQRQIVRVLTAAQEQDPPEEIVEPAPPVTIEADATRTEPEDPAAFHAICDALGAASGQPVRPMEAGLTSPMPPEAALSESGPDWYLWGRMATERAYVTLSAPNDNLRCYAVHSLQGATVCLINRSELKVPIQLQLRLPRGVYKWERLSFGPPLPPEERMMLSRASLREREGKSALPLVTRLDRLQSVDLPEADIVVKPGVLQPGELCLYRCTDVSRAARAAVYETRERLQEMAKGAPDSSRRLRRILDEAGDFLDYVCAGTEGSRDRRLRGIHHFLLVTAQAHSLHHNFQERRIFSAETGAATMGALERLTDGLAETSAAIVGLVPKITFEPEAAPIPAVQQDTQATASALVTVSIANAGARSVEMVKIGLDISSLPAGTQCEPEDPAFFGSLHPGQTVRATFHLRYPASMPVPTNRCVGDVSYFVAGAPAHLRPRPW